MHLFQDKAMSTFGHLYYNFKSGIKIKDSGDEGCRSVSLFSSSFQRQILSSTADVDNLEVCLC